MSQDMCVPCDKGYINIRVGAIILKDGRFLMARNNKMDYYYSVGGRIKFGETAEEAVLREVYEETGVRMEIDHLGFVMENYFLSDLDARLGKEFYEIAFYFYMKTPADFQPVCKSFTEEGQQEYLEWVAPDEPRTIFPEFFRTDLDIKDMSVKHKFADDRVPPKNCTASNDRDPSKKSITSDDRVPPKKTIASDVRSPIIKKIRRIRTGGQSGVDRAAMDFAREQGIPLCGWCPKNGWAEDYPDPPGLLADYPELTETPSEGTAQRTKWNMRDCDAILTIIPDGSAPSPGTAVGLEEAQKLTKPMLTTTSLEDLTDLINWISSLPDGTELCIGGPRASECPEAYNVAMAILNGIASKKW